MDKQNLIQSYRFFDIACGLLETNERMRNELFAIRQHQIKSKQKSIIERSLIILASLITGVPILDQLIDENNITYKCIIIFLYVIVVCLYWLFSFLQYREETKSALKIDEELKISQVKSPEETPTFLLMLASTYGTRLSLAKEVLSKCNDSDIDTKDKFSNIVKHWESAINHLKENVEKLYKEGLISDNVYKILNEWLNTSISNI